MLLVYIWIICFLLLESWLCIVGKFILFKYYYYMILGDWGVNFDIGFILNDFEWF